MKQTLYPKTERIKPNKKQITEKIDGSNIGFFKLNGELIIAQRNNVYTLTEIQNVKKDDLYKGLKNWLSENAKNLTESLHEGSGFFGEWIGMGKLNYNFDFKVLMFAKANIKISESFYKVYNIYYDRKLFIYPFVNQIIPKYIGIVPLVKELYECSIQDLDELYDEYCALVNRPVEGFIIIYNNDFIQKYVRCKNGKIEKNKW